MSFVVIVFVHLFSGRYFQLQISAIKASLKGRRYELTNWRFLTLCIGKVTPLKGCAECARAKSRECKTAVPYFTFVYTVYDHDTLQYPYTNTYDSNETGFIFLSQSTIDFTARFTCPPLTFFKISFNHCK